MRAGHEDEVTSGLSRTVNEDPLDAALDRELEAALRVDPSPSLAARVRTQVADREPSTTWGFGWIFTAGAVAVAAFAALTFTVTRRSADTPSVNPPLSAASSTAGQNSEPATLAAQAQRPTNSDQRSTTNHQLPLTNDRRPTTNHQRPPAVQFSQAEVRGFRQLVRLANQEDPALAGLLSEHALPPAAEIRISELQIAPVVIEFLAPEPAPEPDTF